MFLHLGNDIVVRESDIIGIFDMENTTTSKQSRNFLALAEKNGEVINVSYELPKTFVVCHDGERTVVYISPISSATLLKRSKTLSL